MNNYSEILLEAIGNIDDDLILGAESDIKPKKNRVWIKTLSLAACLAVVVFAGAKLLPNLGSNQADEFSDLPMLTVSSDDDSGYGFEGYMAFDISELVNANPWSEDSEISTLPVFKNTLTFEQNEFYPDADIETLEEILIEIAERFDFDIENLEISYLEDSFTFTYDENELTVYGVSAEENGISISVFSTMGVTVTFNPALELPSEYNYSHYSTYEEMEAVAEYIKETYSEILGMSDPVIDISDGDYNIYQQQKYGIAFYESADDITDEILNYNFRKVTFSCDDGGNLWIIRFDFTDISNKVSDYPIISVSEARELLLDGQYISSSPCDEVTEDAVAGVELVYRSGRYDDYYIPYYKFYVELPEEYTGDTPLSIHGAYYVPAVESRFLENTDIDPLDDSHIYS